MPNGISPGFSSFADQIGEAIGRGVARGINAGLAGIGRAAPVPAIAPRRRGRPPKAAAGSNVCTEPGCGNPARSKGLCSKHYQASRRKILKRK